MLAPSSLSRGFSGKKPSRLSSLLVISRSAWVMSHLTVQQSRSIIHFVSVLACHLLRSGPLSYLASSFGVCTCFAGGP
eukprot:2779360-Pyramimonas_sp.AAC.1